jgi:hypothetical protein
MTRPKKRKRDLKEIKQDTEYDKLMNHFDYSRGYLSVPDDTLSLQNIDNVYSMLDKYDYSLGPELPKPDIPKKGEETTWKKIIEFDYIPPEVISEEGKWLKYKEQLESMLYKLMDDYERTKDFLLQADVLLSNESKKLREVEKYNEALLEANNMCNTKLRKLLHSKSNVTLN